MNYNVEEYWNNVAENIKSRDVKNLLEGDDEPYYNYKRKLFLQLLDSIDFEGKKVLEIGSGPGGNLHYLKQKKCKEIAGVDISASMIALSKRILADDKIIVRKIDGTSLPFPDKYFDIVFTSTVLQHNTDEKELAGLINNICRVSGSDVILFERIEKKIMGHETNTGRPVAYYADLLEQLDFTLIKTKFLKIQASYFVCGAIRKLFNRRSRNESEPISKLSRNLELVFLPLTKILDKFIGSKRDMGMLYFRARTAI